ncbi:MAG TPA: lipopolysaccharide heptosyltransferase II [Methylomirabilota bacterium]|nr:lipopolysaccharide heptosyltransferase II [Methylomirabilota bacterium]
MNHDFQRILVRGVNWLGDAVMTTPALQRLREAHPAAHITLLTPAKLAELWTRDPAVDAVLAFEPTESLWAVAGRLRAQRCDVALVLPNSPRSALETFLARIPVRIGRAGAWRNIFLTRAVVPRSDAVRMHKRGVAEIRARLDALPRPARATFPAGAHHLHDYLYLVAALGGHRAPLPPRLVVTAEEVAAVRQRWGAPATPGQPPLLGLNAGAEYGPAKRWPESHFVAAAAALQREFGCHCWIFGGRGDMALAGRIAAGLRAAGGGAPESVRNLAGATTLRELLAALRACDVVLTNDTGPMHVAAAVGTPVVVPFGSTSPELTGPGLPGDARHALIAGDVPCAPCFRRECPVDFRCMAAVSVERVVEALRRILAAGPRG